MTEQERQAALDALNRLHAYSDYYGCSQDFKTVSAALQSPRVPDNMFKKLGSLIKAVDGGTFEDDPHDAIIDAAIRTLSSPRVPDGYIKKERADKFIQDSIDLFIKEGCVPPRVPVITPQQAIYNLTNHQIQLDMDGIMVSVSRQALNEVLNFIRAYAELQKGV